MTGRPDLKASTGETDPALTQIVDELIERLQAGEDVDMESVIRQHPEHAESLRRMLPALAVLVDFGETSAPGPARPPEPGIEAGTAARSIGEFRLICELGRGGMGVVYEAEQLSLGRRVALKVLPMAAALDERQMQRFRVEAQAAACLHHPHIVPVYGVGCERGVHYYAMQLIDGHSLAETIRDLRRLEGLDDGERPLAAISTTSLARALVSGSFAPPDESRGPDGSTIELSPDAGPSPARPGAAPATPQAPASGRTAAASGTSTRDRTYIRSVARMGLQAAEALDHAHQRGILHRDVKPGNLLLDAAGHLWVADFGLAHVQGDSNLTATGDILGTLRYMSPEQALGRRAGVDGRSDVYSLGVTLYELRLRPAVGGEGRAEILRHLANANEEPVPLRRSNPAVPRDLETIVRKAMEKEPAQRFDTAGELAQDLRRFLEDRPIAARRPSPLDRAAKWSRRHRVVVAAAAVLLVAAVAGLSLSTALIWQEQRRTRAALDDAREQRRLALEAVDDYLMKVSQNRLLNEPGMQPLRKELVESAQGYYREFLRAHGDDPALRSDLAHAHRSLGEIKELIGQVSEALAEYEAAAGLYRTLVEAQPGDTKPRENLAVCLRKLGGVHRVLGDREAAERSFQQAIDHFTTLVSARPGIPEHRAGLAYSHNNRGVLQDHFGDREAAERSFEQAIDLYADLAHTRPEVPEYQFGLAFSCNSLGGLRQVDGRPGETERLYRRAIDLTTALTEAHPTNSEYRNGLAMFYNNLGNLLNERGDFKEARRSFGRAIELRTALTEANPRVSAYLSGLAGVYLNLGNLESAAEDKEDAEASFGRAIEILEALVNADPAVLDHRNSLAKAFVNLGSLKAASDGRAVNLDDPKAGSGDLEAAERSFRRAIELLSALAEADPTVPIYRRDLAAAYLNLGMVEFRGGNPKAAEVSLQRANELWSALVKIQPDVLDFRSGLAGSLSNLGMVQAAGGDREAAEASLGRANELLTALAEADPDAYRYRADLAGNAMNLGKLKFQGGDREAGVASFRRAAELFTALAEARPDATSYRSGLADSLSRLGMVQAVGGDREAAEASLGRANELLTALAEADPDAYQYRTDLAGNAINLGNLKVQGGDREAAEASFRRAAELFTALAEARPDAAGYRSGLATSHRSLGIVKAQGGDREAAEASFRRAAELLASKDPAEAVETARVAVEFLPDSATCREMLGTAQFRTGDWEAAIEAFERAIDLRGEAVGADFLLAMARWQKGEREEARRIYDYSVKWTEEHEPRDDDLRRLRDEATKLMNSDVGAGDEAAPLLRDDEPPPEGVRKEAEAVAK